MVEQDNANNDAIKDDSELSDITKELEELGVRLQRAIKTTSETDEAQELKRHMSEVCDDLEDGMRRAGGDIKSGKVAEDAKRETKKALRFLNNQLKEFSSPDDPKSKK